MALGLDEILIRMRLMGARQVAAESQAAATSIAGMGSRMESAGKRMTTVGRTMTTGLTLPIALIGGAAIKMSLDFDQAMTLVHTQAGATAGEVSKMRQPILDLAQHTEHGPVELAQGLFRVESAGFRGAQALDVLRTSAEGADVGQAGLEDTTKALSAAVRSGIRGAQDYHTAMGTLNAAVGLGNMRMEDLVGALSTGILPAGRAVGLGLKDVTSAIDVMTRAGVPAQAAATRLRMTFSLMAAPTDQAKTALASIGLQQDTLAKTMRGPSGLPGAVQLLATHLDKLPKVQQMQVLSQAFGGGRTSAAIMTMIQNVGTLGDIYDQTGKKAGEFGADVEAQQRTPAARIRMAWAGLQSALVELGAVLIPVVVPAILAISHAMVSLLHMFDALPGPIKEGVVIFFLLLAIAGPILMFFGSLVTAIGVLIPVFATLDALISPWFLLVVAVIAVAAGFYLLYTRVKVVHDIVNAVWGFIKSHWPLLLGPLAIPVTALMLIIHHFSAIRAAAMTVVNWIRGHWKLLVLLLGGPIGFAVLVIIHHFTAIKNFIAGVFTWIIHAVGTVAHAFSGPFGTAAHLITIGFNAAKSAVMAVIHAIGAALQWLIDKVKGLADAVSSIPGSIWNKVPGHGVVDTVTGGAGGIIDKGLGFAGLASGGYNLSAGWRLIGEEGPELMYVPMGASVIPSSPAVKALGSTGTPAVQPIPQEVWNERMPTVVAKVFLRRRQIAEAVADEVADHKARK